jgi:hypothetical protein
MLAKSTVASQTFIIVAIWASDCRLQQEAETSRQSHEAALASLASVWASYVMEVYPIVRSVIAVLAVSCPEVLWAAGENTRA